MGKRTTRTRGSGTMIFDEAKTLLSRVAVLDNRNVDGVMVEMWQAILDPFTLEECMWALREFSRNNSQEYLRPAHLVEIIRRKRAEYAAMNPARLVHGPDGWLKFEAMLEEARAETQAIRAEGARYAVEAMEQDQEETDGT
jgi:hypothetical protein